MSNDAIVKAGLFAAGLSIGTAAGYILGKRTTERDYIDEMYEDLHRADDWIDTQREIVNDIFTRGATELEGESDKIVNKLVDEKPSLDDFAREKLNRVEDAIEEGVSEIRHIGEDVREVADKVKKFAGSITEKVFQEDDDFEKLTGTYFKNEGVLVGFNDDFDEIDASEIGEDIFEQIANATDSAVYFKNEDEGRKYEILISENSYDDAYAEYLQTEIANEAKEE